MRSTGRWGWSVRSCEVAANGKDSDGSRRASPTVSGVSVRSPSDRREDLVDLYRRLAEGARVPAGLDPDAARVRIGQRRRGADVRRRGPRRRGGSPGQAFVGRAGKLLDSLLEEIGLGRDETFVANVLKCRPPGNRDPLPGGDRGVQPVALPPDRADRPARGLHAGKLRHQAAHREPGGDHQGPRGPADPRARRAAGAALPDLPSRGRAADRGRARAAAGGLREAAGPARGDAGPLRRPRPRPPSSARASQSRLRAGRRLRSTIARSSTSSGSRLGPVS